MNWLAFSAVAFGAPLIAAICIAGASFSLWLEDRYGRAAGLLVPAAPILLAIATFVGLNA